MSENGGIKIIIRTTKKIFKELFTKKRIFLQDKRRVLLTGALRAMVKEIKNNNFALKITTF